MNNYILFFLGLFSFIITFCILFFGYDIIKELLMNFDLLVSHSNNKYLFSILFSLIVSFGLGVVFFFYNLNKKNKILNNVLNELNFQQKTLDKHSIVSMTDLNGTITYVNDKFCEISGYTREELIGKNHRIVKSDEHSSDFFRNLRDTIFSGKIWQGEVKNRNKNGEFYWVRATIVPFFDTSNKISRFVSIRTDITEAKKVQERLLKAKIAIEESNKAKSDFLANMSHELKTPLNSINLLSSIMMKNKELNLSEEQLNNLTVINKCGKKLSNLINDVLDISKLDTHKIQIKIDDFSIEDLIYEIYNKFKKSLDKSNLELLINIDKSIENIQTDRDKLSQVISNLFDNAIKFTHIGKIEIDVKNDNNNLLISFKDEGIGIKEDKIPLIFDRFKQIDSSTNRKYTGTGLGLAICKELIHLLNGEISVKSEFGKGSIFTIKIEKSLIIKEKKVEDKKEKEFDDNIDEIIIKDENRLENSNILILNDEPIFYFNIIVNLKRVSKKVESVNNLDKFFNLIKNEEFNKIIIDFKTFSKENIISLFDERKDIYLVDRDDLLENEIINKNVKGLLSKPFNFNKLITILDEHNDI